MHSKFESCSTKKANKVPYSSAEVANIQKKERERQRQIERKVHLENWRQRIIPIRKAQPANARMSVSKEHLRFGSPFLVPLNNTKPLHLLPLASPSAVHTSSPPSTPISPGFFWLVVYSCCARCTCCSSPLLLRLVQLVVANLVVVFLRLASTSFLFPFLGILPPLDFFFFSSPATCIPSFLLLLLILLLALLLPPSSPLILFPSPPPPHPPFLPPRLLVFLPILQPCVVSYPEASRPLALLSRPRPRRPVG